MAANAQSNRLTVTNSGGNVLWADTTPVFNANGSFTYSGNIPAGSNIFGFGDKPDSIDKLGKSYVNYNLDTYRYTADTSQMYRTLPFYIKKTGNLYTGYFQDNTWKSTFDFGKTQSGVLSMQFDGGAVDLYVIAGASPKEVLANYAALTGTTPFLSLWAYGWQQSKYSYFTASEVTGIVNGYRSRNIPLDAIWLDIGALGKNTPFLIGQTFQPFTNFVTSISNLGVKTVVLTNAHPAVITDGSYPAYTGGSANGYFVRTPTGGEYQAKVWPWANGNNVMSVFPDFTRKTARDWWGTLFRERYVTNGVAGIWNDMNEPTKLFDGNLNLPDDLGLTIEEPGFATRNVLHKEVHNVYGMQNSRGTYEGLLALKPNQRPFVMTRASYTGGQRYAVTWTGDNQSTWDHMRIATNQIAGLGLAGFLSTPDIGGYANNHNPSSLLLTRWIQVSAFYPITRTHAETGKPAQEPYENGSQNEVNIRTKYIRERYSLLPYLYTLGEEASRTGLPMLRRMFLEFPQANAPGGSTPIDVAAETQFMFGPSLLVAPSPIEQGFKPAPSIPIAFGANFEAEVATLTGGAQVDTDHNDYTGRGFVAGYSATGAQLSAALNGVPSTGNYSLQLRYSNGGTGAKTLGLIVDGTRVTQVSFPTTANWDTWANKTVQVSLSAGNHTIALARQSQDSGSINIDSLAVTAVGGAFPASTEEARWVQTPYDVLLPAGRWYNYWTGAVLSPPAGTTSSWTYRVASPSVDDVPVFVRGGSIIPRLPRSALPNIKNSADVAATPTLQLDVYPGAAGEACQGTLYTDDGNSFAFRTGASYRRTFTCSVAGNQLTVNFGAVQGSFNPAWTNVTVTIPSTGATRSVPEGDGATSVTLPFNG